MLPISYFGLVELGRGFLNVTDEFCDKQGVRPEHEEQFVDFGEQSLLLEYSSCLFYNEPMR
jgi:hypothetical protein